MVHNGMTPQEALEASTRVAADLLGILDHAGTIEVGSRLILVLIDGDPSPTRPRSGTSGPCSRAAGGFADQTCRATMPFS